MVNIVTNPPKTLMKFLGRFQHLFSRKQFISFGIYVSSLLLDHSRFSIQEAWNKAPDTTYRKIHYFLSVSKWDPHELNNARVALLKSGRTTKSTVHGVLAIDDTNCHKKWAFKTEGAMPQWSTTAKGVVRGNVGVTSAFCSASKHFPVNHIPYRTIDEFTQKNIGSFKSKIDIATDLVDDAMFKGIAFSDIVFDTWYAAESFIGHIEKNGLTWITEFDADRNIYFRGKRVRADELVKLVPPHKMRKVTALNSAGKEISFWCFTYTTKVKGLKGKKKIVVAKGSWDDRDEKVWHVFATNHLSLNTEQVIHRFSLRWKIECLYRELKDSFYFDHFQVRKIHRIDRHWHLCMLSHSFLYWVRCNGYLSKRVPENIETLNEYKRAFNSLTSASFLAWIDQNRKKFQDFCRQNRRRVY